MLGGLQNGGGCAVHDGFAARGAAAHGASRRRQAIAIRGGSGLGDAVYLQSIARYFIGRNCKVEVCTDLRWREVFAPLGPQVSLSPFRRERIDRLAHYSMRRERSDSTQFEDCCIQAGIKEPISLRLDWQPRNLDLLARFKGKPIILVPLPRAPFARTDGYGMELLPDCRAIQRAIDQLKGRAFVIQVGSGVPLFRFCGLDCDLAGQTSVSELLDLAWLADGVLAYCSFMVPLAEAMAKPGLFVWSRRGLHSRTPLIRTITPRKIFTPGHELRAVIDDCTEQELAEAVDAICLTIGDRAEVQS